MPIAQGKPSAPSSAAPHTQEQLFSPNTSVANAASAVLPWGASSGPDSLLNVTVPALPTVIVSGTYAITVATNGLNFTVGGYFVSQLDIDLAGNDVAVVLTSALTTAADRPNTTMSVTWYLTAGMQLQMSVINRDGVAARDFNFGAFVQRVG